MVTLTVDGKEVSVPEHTTILNAAYQAGSMIPTLCYLKDINEIGACRICVVEVEGTDKLVSSCNNEVAEGMVVNTMSPRVVASRRETMALILSRHKSECTTCTRNGNCMIQRNAAALNITNIPYPVEYDQQKNPTDFPLVRDASKCISCMRCVSECSKVQSLNVWDLTRTGSNAHVGAAGCRDISEAACALCGQCITHCPCGALSERDDTQKVFDIIADPERIAIVQIAPSIRTAWGESVSLSKEEATMGRMVAAVRKLGFDYVFDTDFAADMTIMEEGTELLHHLKEEPGQPMFTSCCPGWVRFLKAKHPSLVKHLSTTKSPQQIFGAIAKNYYAEILGVDPAKIAVVSIMPCVAKKAECAYEDMDTTGTGPDVDVVLTTRELGRMLKAQFINVRNLPEEEFDMPLGEATGAGHIFGATGGVMEAALRSAHFLVTGENPDPDAFSAVRGCEGWREVTYNLAGKELTVAIVSGLQNADNLCNAIENGEVDYDFVEVMACPGGCVGGGGQPIHEGRECAAERELILRDIDTNSKLRFSHENPSVVECYEKYFGEPNSEKAERLLHSDHFAWGMPAARQQ